MLKLPDDPFVAIELVSGSSASASGGDTLSHFVIKVKSMDAVLAELAAAGIHPDEPPVSPDGSDGTTNFRRTTDHYCNRAPGYSNMMPKNDDDDFPGRRALEADPSRRRFFHPEG
jgi:hypothetical protein